jgi:hypothetical protein
LELHGLELNGLELRGLELNGLELHGLEQRLLGPIRSPYSLTSQVSASGTTTIKEIDMPHFLGMILLTVLYLIVTLGHSRKTHSALRLFTVSWNG